MNKLTVNLQLPRDLIGILDVVEVQVETRIMELIALELFREERISSGKAAELTGKSKLEFIHLLAQYGIPYFTESSDELEADVAMLDKILG